MVNDDRGFVVWGVLSFGEVSCYCFPSQRELDFDLDLNRETWYIKFIDKKEAGHYHRSQDLSGDFVTFKSRLNTLIEKISPMRFVGVAVIDNDNMKIYSTKDINKDLEFVRDL